MDSGLLFNGKVFKSLAIIGIALFASTGSLNAINIKLVDSASYDYGTIWYLGFAGNDYFVLASKWHGEFDYLYRRGAMHKEIFKTREGQLSTTLNGKVLLYDEREKGRIPYYRGYLDPVTLKLIPHGDLWPEMNEDHEIYLDYGDGDDAYVRRLYFRNYINGAFESREGTQREKDLLVGMWMDDYGGDRLAAFKQRLSSLNEKGFDCTQGRDFLLEMHFLMGRGATDSYAISSFSDEGQWSVNEIKMKNKNLFWRTDNNINNVAWHLRPEWFFLNPRFVIGPLKAVDHEDPILQFMYGLGVLDLKGNAIQFGLDMLFSVAVSENGRYVLATGMNGSIEHFQKSSKYATYQYEITYTGKIIDDNVRFRDGPNRDSKVLGKLSKNTPCTVLEHSRKRETIDGVKECWYKIKLENGTEGWVFGSWVDFW